jgi:hypothetical protein
MGHISWPKLTRHQNANQNWDIKTANISFENVSVFKYMETTVINQNLFKKKIKRRLDSGNLYYYSVQNLLTSRLLGRNVKFRIYETIMLSVVLYGCETWYLTLREEHRLRVFEYRVLRKTFGPKGVEVIGGWRTLQNGELHNLYSSPSIMRMAEHVARIWVGRNAYTMSVIYRIIKGTQT